MCKCNCWNRVEWPPHFLWGEALCLELHPEVLPQTNFAAHAPGFPISPRYPCGRGCSCVPGGHVARASCLLCLPAPWAPCRGVSGALSILPPAAVSFLLGFPALQAIPGTRRHLLLAAAQEPWRPGIGAFVSRDEDPGAQLGNLLLTDTLSPTFVRSFVLSSFLFFLSFFLSLAV